MVDVTRATPEDRARYVNALADRAATRALIDAHRGEFVSLRADAYREASATWDRLTRAAAPPPPAAVPSPPDDDREPLTYRIRRWARIHGVECPAFGRIPRRVLAAWYDAHPDDERPPGLDPVSRAAVKPESIREWHHRTGCVIPCPSSGRIPYAVIDAWRTANPDAPRQRCEDAMERERAKSRMPAAPRPPGNGPASPPVPPRDVPRATTPEPPQRPATATSGTFPTPPKPPTATDGTGRRCAACGNLLSRYNKQDRCSSCIIREEAAARHRLPDPEPDDDLDTFGDDTPIAEQPPRADRSGDYDHPQRERRRAPRPAGAVVLSDGTVNPIGTGDDPLRDGQGRILCRGCALYLDPRWLSCGCDPGELGDDGHPVDPRFAHLTVIPDDDTADAAAS